MNPYLVLRVGEIVKIDRAINNCTIKYIDRSNTEFPVICTIPTPLGTNGTGIYVEPNIGTSVLIGYGYMNQAYIISFLPSGNFESLLTQNNSISLNAGFLARPKGEAGETIIKGFDNTYTQYLKNGNIEHRFGSSLSVLSSDNIVATKSRQKLESFSSHYTVNGAIQREIGVQEQFIDDEKLISVFFADGLYDVGRKPEMSIGLKSDPDKRGSTAKRNPPFVESRSVHYEFARDYSAGNPSYEEQLFSTSTQDIYDLNIQRQGARTDAFGLGPQQYNLLAESILGTAVDIYGNILDLNRAVLDTKSIEPDNVVGLYELLRRSTKVHFELNSRKQNSIIEGNSKIGPYEGSSNTIADHSRFFIDIDAEGQMKLNVPASSANGNISVNARYLAASYFNIENPDDRALYASRDDNTRGAVDIVASNYSLTKTGVEIVSPPDSRTAPFVWNMPYHDFTFTDILSKKNYFYPGTILGNIFATSNATYGQLLGGLNPDTSTPMKALFSSRLSNTLDANAGGRSAHVNLDGSLELSLGMDQSDNKSLVLDSAGSGLIRFGKDLNGNSLFVAADGNVSMVVGASRRADGNSSSVLGGNFQIFVESDTGVSSIQIVNGNVIATSAPQKNMIMKSAGNLILDAAKDVIINGERIFHYGKYDSTGDKIAPEKEVIRNGNKEV